MRSWILCALVACGGGSDGTPLSGTASQPTAGTTTSTGSTTPGSGTLTTTTQTGGWQCRSDIPAGDLHGGYPNEELLLPEFTAYNYDGAERHKPDLQGHVTVIWFYPAAATAG